MATVLIADDDEGMRMLLSMSLQMAGHCALLAVDGVEGVAMMHRYSPDLIVVDANMPPLDGLHAIARLRADGFNVPAILITAGTQESLEFALDDRTRFLAKPFSPPRFISFVSNVLAEQQSGGI